MESINELLNKTKQNMAQVAQKLSKDLGTLRTGRANPQMVENVRVEYYGVPTPLKNMALLKRHIFLLFYIFCSLINLQNII